MSLKVDGDLEERIAILADLRDVSADAVLREALTEYVTREEARESFAQEALASLMAYEADGLHLTGEELFAWLRTWGSEDEPEMPECHG